MNVRKSGFRIGVVSIAAAVLLTVFLARHQEVVGPTTRTDGPASVAVQAGVETNVEEASDARSPFAMDVASDTGREGLLSQLEKRPQDGDVLSEWGEFVRFKRLATNCRHETKNHIYDDRIEAVSNWRCDSRLVADHAYDDLTDVQLEQIALHDAEAAFILGVRLGYLQLDVEKYKASIRHLHTAFLLSGEAETYETLMSQQGFTFGVSSADYRSTSQENAQSYVWAKAGEELGLYGTERLAVSRQGVIDDEQLDVEQLDTMAAALADQFREERIALVGESFR